MVGGPEVWERGGHTVPGGKGREQKKPPLETSFGVFFPPGKSESSNSFVFNYVASSVLGPEGGVTLFVVILIFIVPLKVN